MTEMGVTGGYVRHRDRMIQQSVFDDLTDTLIACRWVVGTTARPVTNPETGAWETMTTDVTQVLPLTEGTPVTLIDFFPEAEGGALVDSGTQITAPNTFAMDNGTRGEAIPRELGSTAQVVPYTFTVAFYAVSDAVAQAVLNDLADRYAGRLVRGEYIDLWNYNEANSANLDANGLPIDPVVRMDIDSFRYELNTDRTITPSGVHLYFGQLRLEDEVD